MTRRILAIALISGLALVAAASIAGNFVAYDLLYQAFDKYNDSRLDPIGELAWNLAPAARGRHAVVILGDSHARNWNYPGPDVLNLGIPSQTAAQIRLRSDLYRDSLSGNRLIILAGGNDLKSLSTNLARKPEIVGQCLAALEAIVLNHKQRFDQVVLATIPPAFRLPLLYRILLRRDIVDAHQEINAGIRALARKHGARLLDAYALLEPRVPLERLSEDGIHMNAAAYRRLQDDLGREPADPGRGEPPPR